jgi:precorrin-6A/cobalt-precorrin-6A reductase
MAFSFSRPVLLTTGSRNLEPYVRESRRTGLTLAIRVLPHPASANACRAAGISEEFVIAGRGPFSVEENRAAIRRFGIGVLVTKDSGLPGGVQAKVEAAREEGCRLVVVARPVQSSQDTFDSIENLIRALSRELPPPTC